MSCKKRRSAIFFRLDWSSYRVIPRKAEMDSKHLKQQWSEAETQCFVVLWSNEEVQEKLNSATRNKPIFEGLQREMAAAGYTRTVDQLLNKLKKLKKDFRDQKRELGCSGSGRVVSPHLEMLNAVLGDRPANVSTGALCSAVLEETATEPGKRKRDSIGEVLQYMEKSDEVFLLEGREDRQLSKAILESLTNMDAQGSNMIAPDGGAGEEVMCFFPLRTCCPDVSPLCIASVGQWLDGRLIVFQSGSPPLNEVVPMLFTYVMENTAGHRHLLAQL
ncbi:uncharacterized protein LOC114458725 [Gouania willdenowi]|uniref:uncharacterized protein LOC114458725 n=1 Tax=Gouania willdenowi TaxID=441366 RepID=UPI001055B666|nr:uncharacterized protein LOC114458725 [Gouania willdenowi]